MISEKNINKNSCSLRLSLKRGFGGFDGLGEFDGLDGLGGFDGFSGFSEFGEFDGFSGLDFKWFLSFIYSASKGFYLLVDYPLSYTWLNGEPQISRKERYIPRYLQYGLLDDCVF